MKRGYSVETFGPNESTPARFLRARDLVALMAVGKTNLYAMIKAGQFPKPIKLGTASVWPEEDYRSWRARKVLERMMNESI